MRVIILLSLCLAVAIAVPSNPQRIVGGSITSIDRYPYAAALLYSMPGSETFSLSCGGAIINNRSILSAAHCFFGDQPYQWRARVGSTNAHSGGVVHLIRRVITHPQYRHFTGKDNDIAILQVTSAFIFNNNVQPGRIPAHDYDLLDNQVVWAIGWGRTSFEGTPSEQLRHVQMWTVNQNICRNRYIRLLRLVTENMLCAGHLDVDGRGQCQGDSGGPLLHGNTIVGVCSFAYCENSQFPSVNVRVSRYTSWIQSNA